MPAGQEFHENHSRKSSCWSVPETNGCKSSVHEGGGVSRQSSVHSRQNALQPSCCTLPSELLCSPGTFQISSWLALRNLTVHASFSILPEHSLCQSAGGVEVSRLLVFYHIDALLSRGTIEVRSSNYGTGAPNCRVLGLGSLGCCHTSSAALRRVRHFLTYWPPLRIRLDIPSFLGFQTV